jgi:hypothetical protein
MRKVFPEIGAALVIALSLALIGAAGSLFTQEDYKIKSVQGRIRCPSRAYEASGFQE